MAYFVALREPHACAAEANEGATDAIAKGEFGFGDGDGVGGAHAVVDSGVEDAGAPEASTALLLGEWGVSVILFRV